MSIENAFIADIAATPDDDTPRRIYADWLEENGQPQRAEFIRVEVEMAQVWPDEDNEPSERQCPRFHELKIRRDALIQAHATEWFGSLTPLVLRWETHRGFVHSIE